jgi:hypothetical protein
MADLTITIPDGIMDDVVACLCAAGGVTDSADVNAENAKRTIIDFITATVHNVQLSQAQPEPPVVPMIEGLE